MYNSQGQGGKVLFVRRTDFDSLKMQKHLLFIMLKHIFQNTVYVTPLFFNFGIVLKVTAFQKKGNCHWGCRDGICDA